MKPVAPKLSDFNPRLPWWGGDLQTIRNYALSIDHALPSGAAEHLIVPLQDGSGDRLVASLHLPEEDRARPLVVLIHGISGNERSCYMVVAAAYFLARGHAVLKVNLRGAGPSRPYCRGHYHAGLTPDLATVLDRLDPQLTRNGLLPIGFSLGGNLLLKFLGEVGRDSPARRAATVSAPLDLARSCRSLMRWRNYLYHRYIMAHLKRNCTAPGRSCPRPSARRFWARALCGSSTTSSPRLATAMPTPRISTTPTRARISSAASIPRRC